MVRQLERFEDLSEFTSSDVLRRRLSVRVLGERWTDADGVPHRLVYTPGSDELALQRTAQDDLMTCVDNLDVPTIICKGPVFLIAQHRDLVAGTEWHAWRCTRQLCRNELRGWREAMARDASLEWLTRRLAHS
jgi:hypothetical protein